MLIITENAISKVKQLLAAENKDGYGLRVAVQGGGCSGFQYGLTWEKEQKENDQLLEFDGLNVFVDAMSVHYLEGVNIDLEVRTTLVSPDLANEEARLSADTFDANGTLALWQVGINWNFVF